MEFRVGYKDTSADGEDRVESLLIRWRRGNAANAVVNLMFEGDFQSYWSGTASYEAIVPLINLNFDGLKGSIIEMLSGNRVFVDVTSFQNDTTSFANKDDVITYLIHLGYLGYDQKQKMAFVPNEEIRQELIRATRRKKWNELVVFQQESE